MHIRLHTFNRIMPKASKSLDLGPFKRRVLQTIWEKLSMVLCGTTRLARDITVTWLSQNYLMPWFVSLQMQAVSPSSKGLVWAVTVLWQHETSQAPSLLHNVPPHNYVRLQICLFAGFSSPERHS